MAIKKIPGLEHYPGSKEVNGTIQTIINLIPPHTWDYELFLGKGTVMLYKNPAAYTVGIDIDPRIIKLWRAATTFDTIFKCSDALQIIPSLMGQQQKYFHLLRSTVPEKFSQIPHRHLYLCLPLALPALVYAVDLHLGQFRSL